MYRAERVLGRCVNGIHFQWTSARVDDIMPRTRRNHDCRVCVRFPLKRYGMLAIAHIHVRAALLNFDDLVQIIVHFQPDFTADGDRHHRDLQVRSRPKRGAEILVAQGFLMQVDDAGFRP